MPNKRRIARVATGTANSPANQIHPPVPPVRLQIYGVRDREIFLGGNLVSDLTEFKRQIMTTKIDNEWTLVLAIHASKNRVAAQIPGRPNHDVYYNEHKIDFIFSDDWRAAKMPIIRAAGKGSLVGQQWWNDLFEREDDLEPRELPATVAVEELAGPEGWNEWRKKHGPTYVVLLGCQVSQAFEAMLLEHLLRDGYQQDAQGLGTGCKPITDGVSYELGGKKVMTRRDYLRLSKEGRADLRDKMRKLNADFGYYGRKPVDDDSDLILEYYFDVEPKGKWVKVTVGKSAGAHIPPVDTGIPFYDRATGARQAEFRRICDQGATELREHHPITPP
jgi:hypothetical protein